jgi:hypothetical protein
MLDNGTGPFEISSLDRSYATLIRVWDRRPLDHPVFACRMRLPESTRSPIVPGMKVWLKTVVLGTERRNLYEVVAIDRRCAQVKRLYDNRVELFVLCVCTPEQSLYSYLTISSHRVD